MYDSESYIPSPTKMPYKDPDKRREHRRLYYHANRDQELARMAEWRAKNLDRHNAARRRSVLRSKSGLTPEGYDALATAQNGACAICGCRSDTRALHVDHDHRTGKIRGLLCNNCNRCLGLLKDDVAVLRSAITYLERGAV